MQDLDFFRRRPKENYGYIWRYADDKTDLIYQKQDYKKGLKTGQYDDKWNLIAIYPSANAAGKALGKGAGARNIRAVCEGKRKTAYGFHWKYLDEGSTTN